MSKSMQVRIQKFNGSIITNATSISMEPDNA